MVSNGKKVKKLWIVLGIIVIGEFIILGYYGIEIYRQAPPIPDNVMNESGSVIFGESDILDGQSVWQSFGGQELGSIWGHGSYVAPDWTADWLHREALYLANMWALDDFGITWENLNSTQKAPLKARLVQEMRINRYNDDSKILTISDDRSEAVIAVSSYYSVIFGNSDTFPANVLFLVDNDMSPDELREAYAMPENTVEDLDRREKLVAFFFWTSWAAVTEREVNSDSDFDDETLAPSISYTNNWPAEPLVDNRPSGSLILWSILSVVLLLGGIAALVWFYASQEATNEDEAHQIPENEPKVSLGITASMRATERYFWVATGLFLIQIPLGIMTAHYGIEGDGLFGIPIAEIFPYAIVRTWHVQLSLFWIATSWLAAGLYIAPAISGHEPKYQRALVNILLGTLILIVVGSMLGEWFSIRQKLGFTASFWFGHQGYEYLDLGRFWQILLFLGLLIWVILVLRALWPALIKKDEQYSLLVLLSLSTASIALFYGAGLMYGQRTNLAIAEYWRWWVVHLWVEGFFEVFATVVIGVLFTRLGLTSVRTATSAILFSSIIFLSGGILGTFHHLYFSGTPTVVLALGATFSALEVVPLVLIGFEAYRNLSLTKKESWIEKYKIPIYFLFSVSFWNLVGAGLFGFLINPPIALYYMQGLNTTPLHAHAALFGVYGMLGIGLILFCLLGLSEGRKWHTKNIFRSFWCLNIGLLFMILFSLLPIGILQTIASVEYGMWYARSAEFMQSSTMDLFRWLRIIGDVIFSIGVALLAWFIAGLKTGWSYEQDS